MKRLYHPWTSAEVARASEMWKGGLSVKQIARELDRSDLSVAHKVESRRDVFPARRQRRSDAASGEKKRVEIRIKVPASLHAAIKAGAKDRAVSVGLAVRDALAERFPLSIQENR